MSDDLLGPILRATGIENDRVGPEELGRLGAKITTGSLEEFILHPTRVPGLINDQERPPDYFEIHDREWWIDARQPAARGYLLTLVAAAAVGEALGLDHTLWWITKVLPATLTIDDAGIDGTGVRLVVRRRKVPELPAELADDVHPQDFADFVAALSRAATVVSLPDGGAVTFIDG